MSLINTASYSLDSRLERLASGRRRRRLRQASSPQGQTPRDDKSPKRPRKAA